MTMEDRADVFQVSFIQELLERLAKLHAPLESGSTACHLPDEGQLRCLFETAFWASLGHEEGRRVVVTLQFERLDDVPTFFFQAVAFRPESLVKLAPAAVPKRGLAIRVVPVGHDLQILGISKVRLDRLVIDILAPGSLAVRYAAEPVLLYSEGKLAWLHLQGPCALANQLSDWMNRCGHTGTIIGRVATQLVADAHCRGHGGTLVLVPSNSGAWKEGCSKEGSVLSQPYRGIPDAIALRSGAPLLDHDLRSRGATVPDVVSLASKQLRECVEVVADLSQVDGAVVLDSELSVMSFGAMFEMPEGPLEPIPTWEVGSTNGGALDLVAGHGARHQSAVGYSKRQADALVFVLSQDGSVTLFFRHGGALSALRRVERHLVAHVELAALGEPSFWNSVSPGPPRA